MNINFDGLNRPDFVFRKGNEGLDLIIENYGNLDDFEVLTSTAQMRLLDTYTMNDEFNPNDDRYIYIQKQISELTSARNFVYLNKYLAEFVSCLGVKQIYVHSLIELMEESGSFLNTLYEYGMCSINNDKLNVQSKITAYVVNIYLSIKYEYDNLDELLERLRLNEIFIAKNNKYNISWDTIISFYDNALENIQTNLSEVIKEIQ